MTPPRTPNDVEIVKQWAGGTLTGPGQVTVELVAGRDGTTLPGFFVVTGTSRMRVLVVDDDVVGHGDEEGVLAWMQSVDLLEKAAEVDPLLLIELCGHAGWWPDEYWRPIWDLAEADAHLTTALGKIPFGVEVVGDEMRVELGRFVLDGGGLLGMIAGVFGPGSTPDTARGDAGMPAATHYRFVITIARDGDDLTVSGKEELLEWEPVGDFWTDGSDAEPAEPPTPNDDLRVVRSVRELMKKQAAMRAAEPDNPVSAQSPSKSAPQRTRAADTSSNHSPGGTPMRAEGPLSPGDEHGPYESATEHLSDMLDGLRLLHLRFCVTNADRLMARHDGLVALTTALASLGEWNQPGGVPSLAAVDEQIAAHRQRVGQRLEQTTIALPLEDLRAVLRLSDVSFGAVVTLLGWQVDPRLQEVAFAMARSIGHDVPTLGLVADLVAKTPAQLSEVFALASPGYRLRELEVVEVASDPRWIPGVGPARLARPTLSERVVSHLLGNRTRMLIYEPTIAARVTVYPPLPELPPTDSNIERVRRAVRMGQGNRHLLLVHTPIPSEGVHVLHRALGTPLVNIDLRGELPTGVDYRDVLAVGIREACLVGGAVNVQLGDLTLGNPRDRRPMLEGLERTLPHSGAGAAVFVSVIRPNADIRKLLGSTPELKISIPSPHERRVLWQRGLAGRAGNLAEQPVLQQTMERIADQYAMGPVAIASAIDRAMVQTRVRHGGGPAIHPGELLGAVRGMVGNQLGELAEPFSTNLTLDRMVLADDLRKRLGEIIDYGRNFVRVHDEWGFSQLGQGGQGLTVLFGGPPGTGKTVTAAIIARELDCELFRIDLSRIVDKYIGETEKNLARVFDAAERSHAVLLFDEADSLFGKRTTVKSSTDRYANLEVNYLLQRMEDFGGTSILTTNYAEGLDEAFQRRIKFRLTFTLPDEEQRADLWQKMMPDSAPVEDDIAWHKLGADFEMSPGHIRNAVLRAAFRAATDNESISYQTLRDAAVVEYRELGNLVRD